MDGVTAQSFLVSAIETLIDIEGPGQVTLSGPSTITLGGFETVVGSTAGDAVTFSGNTTARTDAIDTILGSAALDHVTIADQDNTATVGAIETLLGGSGRERIFLTGANTLFAANVDTLIGTTAADRILLTGTAAVLVAGIETLIGADDVNSVALTGATTITVGNIESVLGSASTDNVNLHGGGIMSMAHIESLQGSLSDERVNIASDGSMRVSDIDTLVGSQGADTWTVRLEPEGGIINTLAGADHVTLTNQFNILSAFNIETLVGGGGGDNVNVGGHFGTTMQISGAETLTGNSTTESVTLSGAATMLVSGIESLAGSTAADSITLGATADHSMTVSRIDTITGSTGQEWITISGGGDLRIGSVETIVGMGAADDRITLAGPESGIIVNGMAGNDLLHLAAGGNDLSAFNVETIYGAAGADRVQLGGQLGGSSLVSAIETVTGTTGAEQITLAASSPAQLQAALIETIYGSDAADTVTLTGGGAVTVAGIETLMGTAAPADDRITLAAPQSGIAVNPLAGADRLTLANGGNTLSAYNVETVQGGDGADYVQLGGHFGLTTQVASVETLMGGSTVDHISLTAGDTLVVGGTGPDAIALRAGAGTDQVGYASQFDGSGFGSPAGADSIANFQSGTDRARVMAGGLLESAISKGTDGSLALTERGQGQVNLSSDEIVYLTRTVQSGGLAQTGFAGLPGRPGRGQRQRAGRRRGERRQQLRAVLPERLPVRHDRRRQCPAAGPVQQRRAAGRRYRLQLGPPGPQRLDDEGIDQGDLLQPVPAAGGAGMAGLHVGAQQVGAGAGRPLAQPGDPLRRLPVGHPRVGQPGGGQDRRIGPVGDVLVGGIAADRVEGRCVLDRVAPFLPFRRGQRQAVVGAWCSARRRRAPRPPRRRTGRAACSPPRRPACRRRSRPAPRCGRAPVNPCATRCSAAAMVSVKVFAFFAALPSRYQRRPRALAAADMGDGIRPGRDRPGSAAAARSWPGW